MKIQYLNQLIDLAETDDIKYICGVEGSGKTILFDELESYITEVYAPANVIRLNLNLEENAKYHTQLKFEKHIESRYKSEENNFILVDNIEKYPDFKKSLLKLHAKKVYKIFVSSPFLLKGDKDLDVLLEKRVKVIKMYPFGFNEYINYQNLDVEKMGTANLFKAYSRVGGLPDVYGMKSIDQRFFYVREDLIFKKIIDVVLKRNKIRNRDMFYDVLDYLMNHTNELISAYGIAKYLNGKGITADNKTVSKFIDAIVESNLFIEVQRYEIREEKYLSKDCKYYVADLMYNYAYRNTTEIDDEKMLSNIVLLELLRRGKEVNVGKLYKKEIDFMSMKNGEKEYIQVIGNLSDTTRFNDAISTLLQIKDNYPKYLITNSSSKSFDYYGIKIMNIADWLEAK